jgi:hypothetical protein
MPPTRPGRRRRPRPGSARASCRTAPARPPRPRRRGKCSPPPGRRTRAPEPCQRARMARSTPRSPPGRPAPGATGAGRRGEVLESTAPSAPPGASASLPEAASLAEAGLTASRIAGSICRCRHRAAISGCEGREGAGQTVKEPGRRCAYAGPLTSHFSCAFTISYRTQFPAGMPDTNLAPRKSRRARARPAARLGASSGGRQAAPGLAATQGNRRRAGQARSVVAAGK